jgi:hypothetical protein
MRNYGVAYWLKRLSHLRLSADTITLYEARIMKAANYNLLSTTIFDVLLGVWTLRPSVGEREFYFSQFLCELSLFCEFRHERSSAKSADRGTATTVNELPTEGENDDNDGVERDSGSLHLLDIALSIVYLSSHFFATEEYDHSVTLAKLWAESGRVENTQWIRSQLRLHKNLANQLFKMVVHPHWQSNTQSVIEKYRVSANYSVSQLKFTPKAKKPATNQNTNENCKHLSKYPSTRSL